MKIKSTFKAAAVALLFAASSQAKAETISFADSFPLEHYLSKEGMVFWMNRAEELTGGEVNFRHFPAGQLAKAKGILQKVRDGAVQAGYVGIGYASDRMPLNGASMIAGMTGESLPGSQAYWKLVKEGALRHEFDDNGVVPLFAAVLPAYQLVLAGNPIKSVDELKGMKIRSSGTLNLAVEAFEGTPVSLPAPDIYLGIQRGTLDGSLLPPGSVKPYNLQEVIGSTSTNGSFGTFAITAVMNADAFNALSEDQQAALIQAGDETVIHLGQYQDEKVAEALQEFRDLGIAVYELDQATLDTLNPLMATVKDAWVARMEERGLNAAEVVAEFEAAVAEAEGN
ncbi:TRAP transporter substrate-binding protein DctP [uncultured Ruegeria sp.]|uniref:TRAP transporter substrate-binding protein n=1 Tax=uncultured Ruegeria sp. TaxID=259304 RepID=UPI00262A08D9|nr:TRAP transporter substrate-binding protein DctP [uncultured Ruegeria sp.]